MGEIMNHISSIFNIILGIVSIVVGVMCFVNHVRANITQSISQFINAAEFKDISGPEKMSLVIQWTKDIIPRIFHVVFSDDVIKLIAQNIFDDMRDYAKKYLLNQTGKTVTEVKKTIEILEDDPEFEKVLERNLKEAEKAAEEE